MSCFSVMCYFECHVQSIRESQECFRQPFPGLGNNPCPCSSRVAYSSFPGRDLVSPHSPLLFKKKKKKVHIMAKYSVWAHFLYGCPPLTGTPWGNGVHVLAPFPSPSLIYLLHVRGCSLPSFFPASSCQEQLLSFLPPFAGLPQASCVCSPNGRNGKTKSDGWVEKGMEGRACCLFYPFPQLSVNLLGDSDCCSSS